MHFLSKFGFHDRNWTVLTLYVAANSGQVSMYVNLYVSHCKGKQTLLPGSGRSRQKISRLFVWIKLYSEIFWARAMELQVSFVWITYEFVHDAVGAESVAVAVAVGCAVVEFRA
jgi:hypothetical protein